MRKLFFLITVVLMAFVSANAEKMTVFDVEMSTLQAEIQWNPNWAAINNNKGLYKDADGDYVSIGFYRGATENMNPLQDLAEGDTAILTVDFWMKQMVQQNMESIIYFGLAEGDMYKTKVDAGSNGAFGGMDQTKVAGYYISQSEWSDGTTNLDGTMKLSADMGTNFTASDAQLWGLAGMNSVTENTAADSIDRVYIDGNMMQCVYKVVKTSRQDILSISAVITNTETSTEVLSIAEFDFANAAIYNSDSLYFVTEAKSWGAPSTMAIVNVKLERTGASVEPIEKADVQLLNSNGGFELGTDAGWNIPVGGYTVEAGSACPDYDATSAYGLHIKNDETAKIDGLSVADLDLVYGNTYTFEMKVKAVDYSNYGNAQLISLRIQPNAWNDNFKDNLTKAGTGWGMMVAEGTWTRVSMTKTIESYDKDGTMMDYLEGAVAGDVIPSRIYFQSVSLDSLELLIDDVRVYEGTLVDEANTNFIEPVTSGLNSTRVATLSVAPNPTTGYIQLSQFVQLVEVYTVTGALVHTATNTASLDVSNLGNGIYFLRTESEILKFIKQ